MSRHNREQRGKKPLKSVPTDDLVSPTYDERQLTKAANTTASAEQPLALDQELSLAAMDRTIPVVDFHGKTRGDVQWEIDDLFEQHSGRCVRIIYGRVN
jgi:hypothetical protein